MMMLRIKDNYISVNYALRRVEMARPGKRCAYMLPIGLQCVAKTHGMEDYCPKHLEWHPDCVLTEDEKSKQKSEKSYHPFR